MSDYVITTDSNSDVPAAFLAAHPLTIIPSITPSAIQSTGMN